MLPLYDAILVPDDRDAVAPADMAVPEEARDRVTFTGPVMARERVELLARDTARFRLGVEGDRLAVYVSAGGGGDPCVERRLLETMDVLGSDTGIHLVIGAGPLYRGRVVHGPRMTWLAGAGVAELMPGLDVAISAAGYNTFFELMHAGIPSVFLPQEKVADEQRRRAERAVSAGAAVILDGLDASSLRAAIGRFRDPEERRRASAAASALVPRNNARAMAAELLRLVLPPSEIEAAEEGVTDELLAASVELGTGIDRLFEIGRLLTLRKANPRQAPDAVIPEADPASVSRHAAAIARATASHGIPMPQAMRIINTIVKKIALGGAEARARAVLGLLGDFAAFDDWAGADSLMKVFVVERDLAAPEFAADVGTFLGRLHARGDDLYGGIACLCAAQDAGAGDLSDNRDLLRRASARLAGERG
ncbi:MAG: glycosyltransferase [Spirochaetes bacterium]|nr:glycosyltransferase [Spirochaetota bacterium]